MHDTRLFEIISWLLIPTVMFGGFSALVLLRGKLSAEQSGLFRAGHAHAGVLLILSLAFYAALERAALTTTARTAACIALLAGVLLQSGGFFLGAFVDHRTHGRLGVVTTTLGALLLLLAIIALVYGLIVGAN